MFFLKKEFRAHEIVGIILLAVLFSFCLKDVVNRGADVFLPEKTVTVRAAENDGNRNVTIVYEGNKNELFPILLEESNKAVTGWNYVEGEPGVRWTSLTIPPEDGKVTIMAKNSPRLYLTVFRNRWGGVLELVVDEDEYIVHDCYLESDSTELLRVFPFQNSKMTVLIKTIIYLFLIIVFSALFFIIGWTLKNKKSAGGKIQEYFRKPITGIDFFICLAGLFALAVFIYKVVGIPNFLQIGDEARYWEELILCEGKWDVAILAERYSFRGYWCYIPPSLAQYIGKAISIDPCILWMLIPSATISWLTVNIFPGLFTIFGGKAKKYHIIPIIMIFITTWRDCITSVSMDLFGVVFLFAGIYYTLQFFKTREWKSAALAGLLSSIAVSFRTANLPGIVAVVLYELILVILHRKKETRSEIRRTIVGTVAGLLAFVVICLPQLQVNIYRNHPGLFPYDHDQAWFGRSLATWSSDYAMTNGNIAYPICATDDQMLTMKNSAYAKDVPLRNLKVIK